LSVGCKNQSRDNVGVSRGIKHEHGALGGQIFDTNVAKADSACVALQADASRGTLQTGMLLGERGEFIEIGGEDVPAIDIDVQRLTAPLYLQHVPGPQRLQVRGPIESQPIEGAGTAEEWRFLIFWKRVIQQLDL